MTPTFWEWLKFGVRWTHLIAGIAWLDGGAKAE